LTFIFISFITDGVPSSGSRICFNSFSSDKEIELKIESNKKVTVKEIRTGAKETPLSDLILAYEARGHGFFFFFKKSCYIQQKNITRLKF
jgi:hypothetical protein